MTSWKGLIGLERCAYWRSVSERGVFKDFENRRFCKRKWLNPCDALNMTSNIVPREHETILSCVKKA
jgi:hypothetical protein